ncbi:hypothetical protein GCM10027418_14000 [Mariniluteicoccus endophyticus]
MTEPKQTGSVRSAGHEGPTTYSDGMAVLSYIIAGILVYGGLGWLGDHFLHTKFLLPAGLILGMVSSIYLIIKRYGQSE